MSQAGPLQLSLHVHIFGAVHVPFIQAGLQTGASHNAPLQPVSQVQKSGAVHVQ